MRAVIIGGGEIFDYTEISSHIQSEDKVICADCGYDHAISMGISPQIVIGDLDSIRSMPKDVPIQKYPPEKNETDLELCITWARSQNIKEFLFLGVTGGRLDHTLANLFLIAGVMQAGDTIRILDDTYEMRPLCNDTMTIENYCGHLLSVIPFTTCVGVTNHGLQYPLQNETLYPNKARGVSNVIKNSPAHISVHQGTLLVMIQRKGMG